MKKIECVIERDLDHPMGLTWRYVVPMPGGDIVGAARTKEEAQRQISILMHKSKDRDLFRPMPGIRLPGTDTSGDRWTFSANAPSLKRKEGAA
jgi:hypothetical protein